jgi:hypothetical protein
MTYDRASGCFPFLVPIFSLWDGETYGPWDEKAGILWADQIPSASEDEFIPVCGPGTPYNINFNLKEVVELYWKVKNFSIDFEFDGLTNNLILGRTRILGVLKDYNNVITIGDQYKYYNEPKNTPISFLCYEPTDYSSFLAETEYEDLSNGLSINLPFGIDYLPFYGVVADPNGTYWIRTEFQITEYEVENYNVNHKIITPIKYLNSTPVTEFTLNAFGQTIQLYDYQIIGSGPNTVSGFLNVDINDYFDYQNDYNNFFFAQDIPNAIQYLF